MKKNFSVLFGLFLATLGFKTVLLPLNVNIGGFAGVSQIMNFIFGLPFWVTSTVLNAGLFLWGARHEGLKSVTRAIVTTLAFSALLDIIPPCKFPMMPAHLEWLCITLASIFVGCGFGLILRGDATTGGSDYLAKIIVKRYPSASMGLACTLINLSIVGATALLFGVSDLLHAVLATVLVNESVNITLYIKSDKPLPSSLKCAQNLIKAIHSKFTDSHPLPPVSPQNLSTDFHTGQILTLRTGNTTTIRLQVISVTHE